MKETSVAEVLDAVRQAVAELQEASCNGIEGLQEAKAKLNAALVTAKESGAGEEELLEAGRPKTVEVDGEAAGMDARKARKMRLLEKEFLNKDRLAQERLEAERVDKERASRVAGKLAAKRSGQEGADQGVDAADKEREDQERLARMAERLAAKRRRQAQPDQDSDPDDDRPPPLDPEAARSARVAQAVVARRAKAKEDAAVQVVETAPEEDPELEVCESEPAAGAGKERRATERASRVAQALAARRAQEERKKGRQKAKAEASGLESLEIDDASPNDRGGAGASSASPPATGAERRPQESKYGGISAKPVVSEAGRERSRSRERGQELALAVIKPAGTTLAVARGSVSDVQSLVSLIGRSPPPEEEAPKETGPVRPGTVLSVADVPIGILMGGGTLMAGGNVATLGRPPGGSSDLTTGGGEMCYPFLAGKCHRWNCRYKHVRPGG